MSKPKFLNSVTADENAKGAAIRAILYSNQYKHLYNVEQRDAGERLKYILEKLYYTRNVYLNHRKQYISIKLEGKLILNKENEYMQTHLDNFIAAHNVQQVQTAQGTIFRIYR